MTRTATRGRPRALYAAALAAIGIGLGGCAMPNSSNPTLRLTSAQISGNTASLSVEVENGSDHNLTLESIDWTLVHGPMPVASGLWEVNEPLASGSSVSLSKRVTLDAPSLDPSSREIALSGQMNFGKGAGIESAAFDASRTSNR
jgi:hypothetical protein